MKQCSKSCSYDTSVSAGVGSTAPGATADPEAHPLVFLQDRLLPHASPRPPSSHQPSLRRQAQRYWFTQLAAHPNICWIKNDYPTKSSVWFCRKVTFVFKITIFFLQILTGIKTDCKFYQWTLYPAKCWCYCWKYLPLPGRCLLYYQCSIQ